MVNNTLPTISVKHRTRTYGELFADSLRVSLSKDKEFLRILKQTVWQERIQNFQLKNSKNAIIVPYRPTPQHNSHPIKIDWMVHLRDGAFLGMDIYAGYIHNHKTYITTKGHRANIYKSNGKVRSAKAAKFAKASRVVKGLSIAGSIISTGISAYEINESLQKGESPETLDVVDLSVGLVGLGSTTLVAVGIISNPIGWGIGLGVTIYGAGRLAYDLFWKEN